VTNEQPPPYRPLPKILAALSLSRTEAGWRLSADVGRSSVNTGGAQEPAEIRRLCRNLLPELFGDLPIGADTGGTDQT
jgi:hypothetical protein